ncbi:MAG: glycosyltransferase family 4 protein, partial [Bacteroidota bacterium]
ADLLFLQTQSLINYFQPRSRHLAHLPTSRELPTFGSEEIPRAYRKRFVFLGHLKKEKGIDEIITVRKQLPEDYVIHLYGPIKEEQYNYLASESITYQGVLSRQEVLAKLDEYDVLLLPTYFSGEGYPGAIIEAYSLGIPVISTHWRSIPEIVLDGETGRLIAPQNRDALLEAILEIDERSYRKWSTQARQQFEANFEQRKVVAQALDSIHQLMPAPIAEQA